MVDPLSEIIALLRPQTVFTKGISGAGRWAVRYSDFGHPSFCTVLEGSDPGTVLVDHANAIAVDHILMGARSHSSTRRYLGSVSSHVVAEAACSVTVIRLGTPAVANGATDSGHAPGV